MSRPRFQEAYGHYEQARGWLIMSDYYRELIDQALVDSGRISEGQLLREHAWVVLNSGFRESVVRARFDYISLCFCDWESASVIVKSGQTCIDAARSVFANERKLSAILGAARFIVQQGFDLFVDRVRKNPADTLSELPHIGSVTALHLAKNLGFNVVKPDRHLVRLATSFGYDSAYDLCRDISTESGDEESVVDLVLWRYQEQLSSRVGRAKRPRASRLTHPPS